ncbi:MAG TPA: hypothetical protein VK902_08065 [Rubrobacter sp.]|nr:hypothetical protein [Rubrobacter sp.]
MARTFSMDTAASPSWMLARTRRAASENGATLVGDERSGHFSHQMVRGQYCRQGRTVIVTITDKHWLLPWGVVERQLRSWFGSRSLPGDREESAEGTTRLARSRRGSRRHPRRRRRVPPRR